MENLIYMIMTVIARVVLFYQRNKLEVIADKLYQDFVKQYCALQNPEQYETYTLKSDDNTRLNYVQKIAVSYLLAELILEFEHYKSVDVEFCKSCSDVTVYLERKFSLTI